ncbi:MAG: NADH:flavin oxidoreductase/NADH oxidase [Desulfobacteraceae bacterium]|nr:NADH:flavin oxidoreductase/NADH oxidase [Desulfobacteraceae bacterium]
MSVLFTPFRLRDVEFKHRVFVSPMCQYSSRDGMPGYWHLVHLGSRAVGGAALVMVEATSVSPEGRITPFDSGLWSSAHANAFSRIVAFLKSNGAVPGIQLAHAGRKASVDVPWRGDVPLDPASGGWEPIAPSAIPFDEKSPVPREMSGKDVCGVLEQFRESVRLSCGAGFEVLEIHMAHGYLLHEFLSPLSNRRTDEFGGSFENRIRFPLIVAETVRKIWPEKYPLFVRISCTDWVEDGWDLEQSIEFCRKLKEVGVDLIDCSSGALVPYASIPAGPGFQVPFAAAVRREADIPTGAVGFITDPAQAEQVVATGQADVVFLARQLLRDPYWPLRAAHELRAEVTWPDQYLRAKFR